MLYRAFRKPGSLLLIPLLLVLIIAVACGEDATATPQPTVTPTTPAATPTTPAATPTPTPSPVPTATPTPEPQPVVGRVVIARPVPLRESTMPWLSTEILEYVRPMYEALITTDLETGKHVPELAAKWEMAADGRSWTLDLQEGVPWHGDWGEFTASDVQHMMERLISDDSSSSDVAFWRGQLEGGADDVQVVNDYRVVFKTKDVQPDLELYLAAQFGNLLVSSRRQWDEQGTDMLSQAAGTGPYRLIKYEPAVFTLFEKVEDHWRHTAEFGELKILFVDEVSTRLAQLLAGEAHLTVLPKDLQDEALAAGMARTTGLFPKTPWVLFWGGLYFADDKADLSMPWTDIKVREALNRAVDSEEVLETIFRGRGELSGPWTFTPQMQGWDPSWVERRKEMYAFDPERAMELLAEAGYPNGFDITIYNYPYRHPELAQYMEATAQYWQAIGVNATIQDVDYAVVRPKLVGRELDGMMGWGPAFGPNPHSRIAQSHTIAGGFSQFDHPFIEERIEALKTIMDPNERDRIQREMGEFFFNQYSEVLGFFTPVEGIYNPEVIEEYILVGTHSDLFTHIEYMKAVKE